MRFREYLQLTEALRIVKKGSDVFDDKSIIGRYQNRDVIKTNHTSELRNLTQRDIGLSNSDFIDILRRIPIKLKDNSYYDISFKNSNSKYDFLVIYVDSTTIRCITVLQQNRDKPNYHIKDGDIKIILESINCINLIL